MSMSPAEYNAWYETARGRWIGEQEYRMQQRLLNPATGDALLDVGCGTGWFTRRFAQDGWNITGLDIDEASLAFARAQPGQKIPYLWGDAKALPFPDNSFERVVSTAALCFIDDERKAVAELVRVTRGSFVIGWLNRHSLLYRRKGSGGGVGAYRGARWHDRREVLELLAGLPVANLRVRSAVYFPGGGLSARGLEPLIPSVLPWGSMLFVAGNKRVA
jgi:SAM-dependent methyltransferase